MSAVGCTCGTSMPRRIVTHRVSWVWSRHVRGSVMLVAVRRAAAPGTPHARRRARVAVLVTGEEGGVWWRGEGEGERVCVDAGRRVGGGLAVSSEVESCAAC